MNKRVLAIGAGAAVAASVFGTVLAVHAENGTSTPPATGGTPTPKQQIPHNGFPGRGHRGLPPFGGPRGPLPPRGGTPLGGQFQYKDANGQAHTIASHPGTVKSKTTTSVTIAPNDGTADQTYTFSNPNQLIQAILSRVNGGDKVTVITDNGTPTALLAVPPMRGPKPPGQRPAPDINALRQRIQEQIDALQKRLNGLPTPAPTPSSSSKTST